MIQRELDLLRLERLLARGRVVYLTGLCGVGKTAFVNYAASIWQQQTNYIEAAVAVDFAMGGSVSHRVQQDRGYCRILRPEEDGPGATRIIINSPPMESVNNRSAMV